MSKSRSLLVLALVVVLASFAGGTSYAKGGREKPPTCDNPIGTISGVVTDAGGLGVAGATVVASPYRGRHHGGLVADAADELDAAGPECNGGGPSATTDEEGVYTITGLCAGNYRVGGFKADVGRGAYNVDADNDGKVDAIGITVDAPNFAGADFSLAAGAPNRP